MNTKRSIYKALFRRQSQNLRDGLYECISEGKDYSDLVVGRVFPRLFTRLRTDMERVSEETKRKLYDESV